MQRVAVSPRRSFGAGSIPAMAVALALLGGSPWAGAQAAAQEQGPVTLQLKATRGQPVTYRFQQEIDLQMPPELGGSQKVRSLLMVQQTLERATADTLRYLAEVKDVGVEMDASPMGGDLDFSRFRGQRFRMSLTSRGEILELEPLGAAEAGTEQLQHSIRQVGFPLLPERPIRVGESWVDTSRVDAAAMALPADGQIVSVNRATLRRLLREGDATVAELLVETTFRFEPGPRAMPGMQVEMTGERADTIRFDVTNGRFLGGSGSQDFRMSMAIPGAPGSLTIQGTARSTASLVRP